MSIHYQSFCGLTTESSIVVLDPAIKSQDDKLTADDFVGFVVKKTGYRV